MSNIFKSGNFVDEGEKRSSNEILRTLLIISIVASAVGLLLTVIGGYGWAISLQLIILLFASIISLVLEMRGMPLPGQILLPITLLIVVTVVIAPPGYGIHDIDMIAYSVVIIIASLTLGSDAAIIFAFLIILITFAIGMGEIRGVIVSPTSSLTNLNSLFNLSTVILAIAFIQRALVNRLNQSIKRALENEQKQAQANRSLEEERANLEQRVQERTDELERRAVQLRAAAEVGNAAASIQDLDSLLDQTVRLLSLRFGFYHAGIFLLDEAGKFAVLRAANSEGGERMLKRGHRLEVGRIGIVGYVADRGEARIALDVGADAVYFNNPDLPSTRSEMTLPLRVAGKILGVLDIQSIEPLAFAEEDIETLQIVADQLAISIENSRLLAESRVAVEATRRAYGETASAAWKERFDANAGIGFRANEKGSVSQSNINIWSAEERQSAMETKIVASNDGNIIYVPILVREETIGILKLTKPDHVKWNDTETQTAETLADQLSGALESARLFDNAQRRAAKEQALSEITSKISASINMRNVLQTAVEELGRAIPGSDVIIQFQSGSEAERPEK